MRQFAARLAPILFLAATTLILAQPRWLYAQSGTEGAQPEQSQLTQRVFLPRAAAEP